jgi:cysteine desulfurase/selenocysteine lyase
MTLGCGSDELRALFPVLGTEIFDKQITHLDTAMGTPIHRAAIDAMVRYCETLGVPSDASVHELGARASEAIKTSRQTIARFIGARESEVIFTKNATDALRMIAVGLPVKPTAEVVISEGEHYSNLLTWLTTQRGQPKPVLLQVTDEGKLELDAIARAINRNTRILSISLVSHITGWIAPIIEIAKLVRPAGILLLVDATQAAGRIPIDVRELDCDFLVFSSAHLYSPSGVGVLYGKREHLDEMTFRLGGGSVRRVDAGGRFVIPADLPHRAESGTLNGAGIVALGAAVQMLSSLGMDRVHAHERMLAKQLRQVVGDIAAARLIGPASPEDCVGIVSFTIEEGMRMATCQQLSAAMSDTHAVICSGGSLEGSPMLGRLKCADAIRLSGGVHTNARDIAAATSAVLNMVGLMIRTVPV